MNLRRCGIEELIQGPARVNNRAHAARQLARPLEELGLPISDLAAKLYPSLEDRRVAGTFLANCAQPIVALHPSSGSERKNWPLENWIAFGNYQLHSKDFPGSLLIISGEADEEQARQLQTIWRNDRVRFAKNLPLPELAALCEHTIFIGHDSGISHLAAAAGAKCILLFGPTDPDIWAPLNESVHVIQSKTGALEDLDLATLNTSIAL
jgi:heptosyltransferase-2